METVKKKEDLPAFLPHGWKREVAGILGIHPNSLTRILRRRSGDLYKRTIQVAKEKYAK